MRFTEFLESKERDFECIEDKSWQDIMMKYFHFVAKKKKNTFFVELFCILFAPPPSQAVRDIATESVK